MPAKQRLPKHEASRLWGYGRSQPTRIGKAADAIACMVRAKTDLDLRLSQWQH